MTRTTPPAREALARRGPGLTGAVALVWLGALLLIYPQGAQWYQQLLQVEAMRTERELVESLPTSTVDARLEAAADYNDRIAYGSERPSHDEYLLQLAVDGTDTIGRLRLPAIDLDQPIRRTMDESSLSRGVGHAEGSSLPVGGASTHAVLGAHRGLATAIGFTRLPEVTVGDMVYVDILGETLAYRVIDTSVVDPHTADVQPVEPGRDLLTLITCTPLNVNSHRFVVKAERVADPAPAPATGFATDLPGFPWWLVWAGAATATAAAAWAGARGRRSGAAGAGRHRRRRAGGLGAHYCWE